MDITTGVRDTGVYAIGEAGMQRWPAGDSTWQAPGVRVTLMDGRTQLAVIRLEIAASKADDAAQEVADSIEPWVKALRALAIVAGLRDELDSVERVTLRAQDEERWGRLEDETYDEIQAMTQSLGVDGPIGSGTCRTAATHLTGQIARGQRLALAYAPDLPAATIHPAWELPAQTLHCAGEPLAPTVAADLLAGWASARDQRDGLITWAVQSAETSRSDVQRITSVSRSTINRLLPNEADTPRSA